MPRTPGFVVPSSYSSKKELEGDLRLRGEASGFTPFQYSDFVDDKELAHYGVKGMKWGVRKDRTSGVPRRTDREARKDAREFARAKMFYGEGAGNRRKLIKATVEGKSRKDPNYKKAFDNHLSDQDMSKHAAKARSERKRKNVRNSTAKTTRGISHMIRGNSRYASAAAATLFGGAMYAHKAGIDKVVLDAGKKAYNKVRDPQNLRDGQRLLRDMGFKV